jgi:HEAT repeat protein
MRRHVFTVFAVAALVAACERNEPVADGQPLRHWAREARQYSLMPWWNSTGEERRHEAFRKLLEIGEPAVPTLLELLRVNNPAVSGDAFNAVCQLGPRARSAVPELLAMLKGADPEQRSRAAWILGRIGSPAESAVPALSAALHDPDDHLRESAAQALGLIAGSGREALERAARDADAGVRQGAISGLAAGRQDLEAKRAHLRAALEDPEPTVRARALERIQPNTREEAEAMVDLLVRGMNDESAVARERARREFIGLYQHQLVTSRLLVAVLGSGDPESRADAAWQLGMASPVRVGPPAPPETLAVLKDALRDPEPKVRIYAARALWAADPATRDVVAETLRAALALVDVELKVRAARVLWQVTHQPGEVQDSYEAGLSAQNRYVRYETLQAIAEMGRAAEPLRPALERLRDDPDPEVGRRAEIALTVVER